MTDFFSTSPRPGKVYYRRECKVCTARRQRESRQRRHLDPEKHAAYKAMKRERKMQKYGLTQGEYLRRVAEQENCCYICQAEKKLYVDHDHATGEVRKLLCSDCNTSLGLLREDPVIIRNLLAYLETL